jgi:hypothetical protein
VWTLARFIPAGDGSRSASRSWNKQEPLWAPYY